MRQKRNNGISPNPKSVTEIHHHQYSGDGLVAECDITHDIPPEVGQLGVRMALAWAIDHCPKIRAAFDADRRRN